MAGGGTDSGIDNEWSVDETTMRENGLEMKSCVQHQVYPAITKVKVDGRQKRA